MSPRRGTRVVEASVRNSHEELIVVHVEPWPDEYRLHPEHEVRLVGSISDGERIEFVSYEGGVTVWFGDATNVEGSVHPG